MVHKKANTKRKRGNIKGTNMVNENTDTNIRRRRRRGNTRRKGTGAVVVKTLKTLKKRPNLQNPI